MRKAVSSSIFLAGLLITVGSVAVGGGDASGPAARAPKHIVLIAGPKSHGPGQHEYERSVRLLKALLDRAPNLTGVETEIHFNGWPADSAALERADTIAFLSDGEHVTRTLEFHSPFLTEERMRMLDKQMKHGCGFVTFHFSTFATARYATQMLEWSGAYFDWEKGSGEGGRYGLAHDDDTRNWHSVIRVAEADIELGAADHPVSRGVRPFHLKDEFYYQLAFRPGDRRLTPILRVPALAPLPQDQIVAWAVTRADGGRGFGTTTGHYFDNWRNDGYRKLILNALVWTAGAPVPEGGVASSYMTDEEVDRALEGGPRRAKSELSETRKAASLPEDAAQRTSLPLYKVLPPAKDSELTPAAADPQALINGRGWSRSNADSANSRYSALAQINRENVARLQPAWTYRSGATDRNNIQANPVIVDGVLYAPAIGKIVVALDAQTGAERWRFKPPPATERFGEDYGPAHRGLIYWRGERTEAPRIFFTANGYLFALDPKTGGVVESFGEHGRVPARGPVAPVIYRSMIVASDLAAVQAFDVRTGAKQWRFEVAARRNEERLGHLMSDGARFYYPGGSVWGGMALDEGRGLVIFATGAPHPNFVGIDRPGNNGHTNSVVAVDARNGELVWAFQDIAHDLWDLDIPAPPNLVTVALRGHRVDAVAQVTKQGNTLLLDRTSGKPLYPFRLRRAPASSVPGERTAPYQPDLELPEPFARQEFTREDITTLSPQAREFVSKQLQGAVLGWFQPPVENAPIAFYGIHGGAEWSGAAFDPASGFLYVTSNELVKLVHIVRAERDVPRAGGQLGPGAAVFRERCMMCHGENREGRGVAPALLGLKDSLTDAQVRKILSEGRNAMPPVPLSKADQDKLLSFLFDRESGAHGSLPGAATFHDGSLRPLLDAEGYPGTKSPWGTLNAIDLNTGKLVWRIALGEYEELTRRGIPRTGTENFGGAMVTAGGLVFCAGTQDRKIRAFDKTTGAELWQHSLPYGGYAPPATYEVNGRQYVVIAATGGGKLGGPLGDAYVAFALP